MSTVSRVRVGVRVIWVWVGRVRVSRVGRVRVRVKGWS